MTSLWRHDKSTNDMKQYAVDEASSLIDVWDKIQTITE